MTVDDSDRSGRPRIGREQDAALRTVLERLAAGTDVAGTAEWEAVGGHLLALAERDAREWWSHAGEYVGAYVAAGLTLFRRRPGEVANAASPWGLAVAKGRLAGRRAAGLEALGGLTGRDPVTHHVRMADAPRVVSLERVAELGA